MTRYLISFDDGAMTFPEEDLPDVAKAVHQVVQQAQDAGHPVSGGDSRAQSARRSGSAPLRDTAWHYEPHALFSTGEDSFLRR